MNNNIMNNNNVKTISSRSLLGRAGMGLAGLLLCLFNFSCDYLDVVPDNIATVDHAFRSRNEAQNYLYGLFGGTPDVGNFVQDPALAGSDEIWIIENTWYAQVLMSRIFRGWQSPVDPWANYWSSRQRSDLNLNGGKPLWTTISDCNVFLENIHKPFDLEKEDRDRWTGEALFVKAYLHFWLFRQYGPIPLIKENLPITAGTDDIMRYREPVDDVVDYIVELLDEAIELLPSVIAFATDEMGRPTKCAAAALKAQVLTLAASPLFNCNPDYADYIDKRGIALFPQEQSAIKNKWKRAADAALEAIKLAEEDEQHRLFDANIDMQLGVLSPETILAMQVRGAVTERWNPEIIWGNSRAINSGLLQQLCCPYFDTGQTGGSAGRKSWAPTLQIVEQFYTKNGLPIEDDQEWVVKLAYKQLNNGRWAMRLATADDRQYIRQDKETIELHFDREARFYASIMFDQGTFFGSNWFTDNTTAANTLFVTEFMGGLNSGTMNGDRSTKTGYLCKKLMNVRSGTALNATSFSGRGYGFPVIRLADVYLLYAEALNECGADWENPHPDVYEYINRVRRRSGLDGVVESWRDHAIAERKSLPSTCGGMREIIQRERLNELAFEGARFWDLRRWKLAEIYFNRPVRGWTIEGMNANEFYQEYELFMPTFDKKDYFTPVRTEVIATNTNMLQSPGW